MCCLGVRWKAGDDAEGHPAIQRVEHIVVAGATRFPGIRSLRDDATSQIGRANRLFPTANERGSTTLCRSGSKRLSVALVFSQRRSGAT
jgi:hypothetical protein